MQREAARNIVSEFREVKLGEPYFSSKIDGLRDFGMKGAGDADAGARDLDHCRLAGMEERHFPRGLPVHRSVVDAETGEQVTDRALEVEEVDGGTAALETACRPAAPQEQRDRAGLATSTVGVEAVALPELEGTDERRPAIAIRAEGTQHAGERRAAELAGLRGEGILDGERPELAAD